MITLITGLPRNGKSLYSIDTIQKYSLAENRPVFYHNIDGLTLPWTKIDDPEKWFELPIGSIIVFDEAQIVFRPSSSTATIPKFISELEVHGHYGHDIFILTQHPMFVHSHIRRLANRHYHVVRFLGFDKATIHEFQKTRDNCDKNTSGSIEHHYLYNKSLYGAYKSADLHTIKKRIPFRLILLLILPFVLIGIIYAGYTSLISISEKNEQTPETVTDQSTSSQPSNSLPAQPPVLSYIESRMPVVQGLPHTAPIYAKATEPVRAPYPAACVVMASKGCHCYTDQATKLDVPLDICMQIVKTGFYMDWNKENEGKYDTKPQYSGVSGRSPDVDGPVLQLDNKPLRASPSNA